MLVRITMFVCALFMAATLQAEEFSENKHYEVLDNPASTTPEIIEYFSFYCMACYRFEPIAKELASTYPDTFKKSHTSGLTPKPGMGSKMTQAYSLALMLNKEQAISESIFKQQFGQRQSIDTQEKIKDIFIQAGISEDDFKRGFNNFSVKARAKQMDKDARDKNITSTPTLIVNGKYKILMNGFRNSDDLIGDLKLVIEQLMSKSS
ncbi:MULTISPECIES: thiol:disulfide interchange protein DsbA/DsbL [Idiomarina]|uniref:Thiol:disulfide interchange protein n=1 Tax=Idiomarina abyssalis TaxID=86102 RepID=A0A8I1G2Y6_9GAMM|nr:MULTISPECIES: thiol:disulfide interchange protein DsbA/DsbL [Idiomarina]MBJ7267050.1 thiol:disulfide interchange protein DsbA/DsbL [Idiomarina abyssalis]MBJ7273675.1 thiol:disulfide interchange protein DsbA/DsbL [Idiomarina abyssalis]MBJ7314978.1 thiol:disulfide interchange protein DsbA/DsbL [Idiomarina abyssalis]MBP58909.1 disulfide isomerase [Idiomarina sp.]MBP59707.1 disulfide isomerase [Idiomarina sp.]